MHREREREKVDFKSREVNCLKECALALSTNVDTFVINLHGIFMYLQALAFERFTVWNHNMLFYSRFLTCMQL